MEIVGTASDKHNKKWVKIIHTVNTHACRTRNKSGKWGEEGEGRAQNSRQICLRGGRAVANILAWALPPLSCG